jgi:hypothetical protein
LFLDWFLQYCGRLVSHYAMAAKRPFVRKVASCPNLYSYLMNGSRHSKSVLQKPREHTQTTVRTHWIWLSEAFGGTDAMGRVRFGDRVRVRSGDCTSFGPCGWCLISILQSQEHRNRKFNALQEEVQVHYTDTPLNYTNTSLHIPPKKTKEIKNPQRALQANYST